MRDRNWEIGVDVVDKATAKVRGTSDEKMARLEEKKMAAERMKKHIAAVTTKSSDARKAAAVKALAETLKIDNPPEPPHRPDTSNLSSKEKKQEQSEYRKKVKEYEEQLKTEIVSPANAALGQIEQEVERLQMEMDAAEASEKEARRKSQEPWAGSKRFPPCCIELSTKRSAPKTSSSAIRRSCQLSVVRRWPETRRWRRQLIMDN